MTKKQALIGLCFVALLFASLDFGINQLWKYLSFGTSTETVQQANEVKTQLPSAFTKKLGKTIVVQASVPATTLFNRLIISELHFDEAVQTSLLNGVQKFGVIYEFSGGESSYFQLRSGLEMILAKDDTVFDANNLGDYSLYYNDAKRKDTVFLLAMIKGRVWGFEYPRKYHDQFQELVKTLL